MIFCLFESICQKKKQNLPFCLSLFVIFPAKSEAAIVFFFLVWFKVATVQNKLDPCTANINKFSYYFDYIVALS